MTWVFYSIIFVILAYTTVTSVTKLNRQESVEAIFAEEVVARKGEVQDITIERDGNGFIITATVIDNQDNQLTPAEITDIQEQLTKSVGGSVIIRATLIPGTLVDFTGFDLRRDLEDRFRDYITEHGGQIADIRVEQGVAGFAIIASVISFEKDVVTDAALADIQANLSETIEAPVSIQVAILPARLVNLE